MYTSEQRVHGLFLGKNREASTIRISQQIKHVSLRAKKSMKNENDYFVTIVHE